MKTKCMLVSFYIFFASPIYAAVPSDPFEDQVQFEIFYAFTYQANVVEHFLLECTGTHDVSYKFGYATAPISNSYKHDILGLAGFVPDPFSNKPLLKRLWDDISIRFTRDYKKKDDYFDPVLMAQKEVLRLMDTFRDDKDVLCDYVFWEEVYKLETITNELMSDANKRKNDTPELVEFSARAEEGLVVLQRLFDANPLKDSSKAN